MSFKTSLVFERGYPAGASPHLFLWRGHVVVGSLQSLQSLHQLIGAEHQHAKHQATHHLAWRADPNVVATEFIFEPRVHALSHRALFAALSFVWFKLQLLA